MLEFFDKLSGPKSYLETTFTFKVHRCMHDKMSQIRTFISLYKQTIAQNMPNIDRNKKFQFQNSKILFHRFYLNYFKKKNQQTFYFAPIWDTIMYSHNV